MTKKLLLCLLSLMVMTGKAQLTYTLPEQIPEFNGTYEDFGQGHFFYPNGGEIRYANKDRTNSIEQVKYYTKFAYPQQYLLNNNSISFVFSRHDSVGATPVDSLHRIDLKMDRSNTSAFLARVDTQNTCVLNYFTNWFGSSGRIGVKGGAAIAVQNVYSNIDMVYCSNNSGLKIFYVVWPGGNPNNIVLHFDGAKSTAIAGNNLVVNSNWESIRFVKPQMYQYTLINNVATPFNVCPASWTSFGSNRYQITTTSSWNSSMPLIIQVSQGPAVQPVSNSINWSTYFGGADFDYMYRTNSDANNNLFTAGKTQSSDFPQNINATPYQSQNSNYDGFLSKFNSSGVLQWSTYIGGSSSELIKDFDFKGGDAWCVGVTSSFNFPLQTKRVHLMTIVLLVEMGMGLFFRWIRPLEVQIAGQRTLAAI